jgi:hypothetical protein
LQTMRVLVYDAHAGRLVHVDLPFWLLRLVPSGRLGSVSGAGLLVRFGPNHARRHRAPRSRSDPRRPRQPGRPGVDLDRMMDPPTDICRRIHGGLTESVSDTRRRST